MAIRLPDVHGKGRHQDFLLVTCGRRPLLHHVLLPVRDAQERSYSSVLPYRAGESLFLVGALPHPDSPRPDGRDELGRLEAAAATGHLVFRLAVAPIGGRFTPVGEIRIGRRLEPELDALRFNPWNTGQDLRPAGWLNGARDRAYELSQAAWRARRNGAELQDDADRLAAQMVRRSEGG